MYSIAIAGNTLANNAQIVPPPQKNAILTGGWLMSFSKFEMRCIIRVMSTPKRPYPAATSVLQERSSGQAPKRPSSAHILSDRDNSSGQGQLQKLRSQIDAADRALLTALGKRMSSVKKLGAYKHEHGLATFDKARWEALMESRVKSARSKNLSPEFVQEIFAVIHKHSLSLQRKKQ